jgi:hypothetical protein
MVSGSVAVARQQPSSASVYVYVPFACLHSENIRATQLRQELAKEIGVAS